MVRKRFLAYPRFRQKAVDTPAGASWLEDEHFDLDLHVRITALPGRSDRKSEKKAFERFVSQLASSPLDKSKPLWQFHLIEKYGTGSAVVARIHHCYADGMALVQVMLSMTDTTRKPEKSSNLRDAWLKSDGADVERRVGAIDRYMKIGGKVLGKGMDMYRDPDPGHDAGQGGRRDRPRAAGRAGPVGRSADPAARQSWGQQARGLGRAAGPG